METFDWILLALITINVAATVFVARKSTSVKKWMLYLLIWIFPVFGALIAVLASGKSITPYGPNWTKTGAANRGLKHADDVLDNFKKLK